MANGPSTYLKNKILDAIGNATSFSVATMYVQLHTADAGAAGTTAVATNSTRKSISFGAAAGGLMENDAVVEWTNVPAAEDYTYATFWDASTAGNFLGQGAITANAVAVGDTFQFAVGAIDVTVS